MKYVIVLLVASCIQPHNNVQALAKADCYTCHRPDYEGTPAAAAADSAVPDHLANAQVYTTQCASCHDTTTWYGHPELLFPRQTGAHAGIQCNSCHTDSTDNSGDAHGNNTQCATCHPSTEQVFDDTLQVEHQTLPQFDYSTQHFCLQCHPTGAAKHHDDTIWPQDHHARTCKDCHDRTLAPDTGGLNALCTKCHQGAHHQSSGVPTGCLQQGCHRGGGGGGN